MRVVGPAHVPGQRPEVDLGGLRPGRGRSARRRPARRRSAASLGSGAPLRGPRASRPSPSARRPAPSAAPASRRRAAPTRWSAGTRASSRKTSLKWALAGDLADRPDLDAGLAHRAPEERDAPVLGDVPVGAGDEHPVLGLLAARRPHLLAVDDPLVAVALGPGLQAGEVGAGAGLGVQQAHRHVVEQQAAGGSAP